MAHRELVGILVQRNIKIRYKNSALGFLWTLLGPLFMIVIYFLFLSVMKFEIDRLLHQPALCQSLKGQRVALLANLASMTESLEHSLDTLAGLPCIRLSAAFGQQHGMRGDNLIIEAVVTA